MHAWRDGSEGGPIPQDGGMGVKEAIPQDGGVGVKEATGWRGGSEGGPFHRMERWE